MIQVVRAHVAAARNYDPERLSTEKLFTDVQRELIAWSVLVDPPVRGAGLEPPETVPLITRRLKDLLGSVWSDRGLKAPARKCGTPAARRNLPGGHSSVHRILEDQRNQQKVVQQPRR